jgi:D-aminopeptidase
VAKDPRNTAAGNWTVAAVVQANYGAIQDLHICGIPIGLLWLKEHPAPSIELQKDGSIIIIVGTDCPLLPNQCDVVSPLVSSDL